MRKIATVATLSCLAGCVSFGQLETGLASFVGKDMAAAYRTLGYPSDKLDLGERAVYVWRTDYNGSLILPKATTTSGTIGSAPVYATTMSTQVVPISYSCTIKLVADRNDRIVSWEYEGNIGGCERYISRLNAAAKPARHARASGEKLDK